MGKFCGGVVRVTSWELSWLSVLLAVLLGVHCGRIDDVRLRRYEAKVALSSLTRGQGEKRYG